jgi:hypothetical protein
MRAERARREIAELMALKSKHGAGGEYSGGWTPSVRRARSSVNVTSADAEAVMCSSRVLSTTGKREDGKPYPFIFLVVCLWPIPGHKTRRKFELDASAIDTLAHEADEAAARQIDREQAEALKTTLPDFWLPWLRPTAGAPRSLGELRVRSTCRGENSTPTLTYVLYDALMSRADDEW